MATALLAAGCSSTSTQADGGASSAAGPSSSITQSSAVARTSAGVRSSAVAGSAPSSVVSSVTSSSPGAAYFCLSPADRKGFRELQVDGTAVDAVMFGSGKVGVLLSHQSEADLCQWHDQAVKMAASGYRVIVPNLPEINQLPVARAAVAELRKAGATSIVLMGASMGATVSLAAAADIKPAPTAVVSLSAPTSFGGLDADTAIADLKMPIFLAAGANDSSFAMEAELLKKDATASSHVELLVVPVSSAHGVDLLVPGGRVAVALQKFLTRYAPPR